MRRRSERASAAETATHRALNGIITDLLAQQVAREDAISLERTVESSTWRRAVAEIEDEVQRAAAAAWAAARAQATGLEAREKLASMLSAVDGTAADTAAGGGGGAGGASVGGEEARPVVSLAARGRRACPNPRRSRRSSARASRPTGCRARA